MLKRLEAELEAANLTAKSQPEILPVHFVDLLRLLLCKGATCPVIRLVPKDEGIVDYHLVDLDIEKRRHRLLNNAQRLHEPGILPPYQDGVFGLNAAPFDILPWTIIDFNQLAMIVNQTNSAMKPADALQLLLRWRRNRTSVHF